MQSRAAIDSDSISSKNGRSLTFLGKDHGSTYDSWSNHTTSAFNGCDTSVQSVTSRSLNYKGKSTTQMQPNSIGGINIGICGMSRGSRSIHWYCYTQIWNHDSCWTITPSHIGKLIYWLIFIVVNKGLQICWVKPHWPRKVEYAPDRAFTDFMSIRFYSEIPGGRDILLYVCSD